MPRERRPDLLVRKLYLHLPDWERVKRIAATEDRTASGLVRQFIAAGLEKMEAERRRGQPAA